MGLSGHSITRLVFRFTPKRRIDGLMVAAVDVGPERRLAIEKIERALRLIATHAPVRFAQLQAHVVSIFAFGDHAALAYWHEADQMIEVQIEHLLDDGTSVGDVAAILVHEATHARLRRMGFGYEEPIRLRIERICFRAERSFARRLPHGEAQTANAEWRLATFTADHFSTAGRNVARLQAMRELGCPRWIMQLFTWLLRRRAGKARNS